MKLKSAGKLIFSTAASVAIILVGATVLANVSQAQSVDPDGVLSISWGAPAPSADTVDSFRWSLDVNGQPADSGVVGADILYLTNFYVLPHEGDWAVFKIRSEGRPYNFSYSPWVYSDTVRYDNGVGVNPPTTVQWITGP